MRRKDREKDKEYGLKVVDKAPYGVVSFITDQGEPYGVPLSLVRINDVLYFHTAKEGKKIDAIKTNPKVSVAFAINVVPSKDSFTTEFESAMVEGMVHEVEDEEEKIMGLKALCQRFCPENMSQFEKAIRLSLGRTGVYKISMDQVTAKAKKLGKK